MVAEAPPAPAETLTSPAPVAAPPPETLAPLPAVQAPPPVETPAAEEPDYEDGAAYLASLTPAETVKPAETRPAGPDPREIQRVIDTHRTNTGKRLAGLDALKAEWIEDGLSAARVERLITQAKQAVSDTYTDGFQYAGFEAAQAARSKEHADIIEGVSKAYTPAQYKRFGEAVQAAQEKDGVFLYSDMFGLLATIAREGHVTKADHDKAIIKAFSDGRAQAEKKAAGARSQPRVTGEPGSTRTQPRTLEEAQLAHSRGEMTTQQMREYRASLGLSSP